MTPLRVLFYGTSSFAVPALEQLMQDERLQIVAVITQPDKPVGRHAELTASPVKEAALRHELPVKQYPSVKDASVYTELAAYHPDIAVVVSFGQIMPEALLELPRYGSLNIHGSLLPMYRGSSPINAAILAGDTETGVTIMKMDAKMDHGAIVATFTEPILPDDTVGALHDRLADRGGREIAQVIHAYVEGTLIPVAQKEEEATYVRLLAREDGEIKWDQPATHIERMIRAYDPWPGTFSFFDKQRLKILAGHIASLPAEMKQAVPGTTCVIDTLPAVVCGEHSALCLNRVQPEGKKPMSGKEFLRGKASWGNGMMG